MTWKYAVSDQSASFRKRKQVPSTVLAYDHYHQQLLSLSWLGTLSEKRLYVVKFISVHANNYQFKTLCALDTRLAMTSRGLCPSVGDNKEPDDSGKSEGSITGKFPSRRDHELVLPAWIRVSLAKRGLSRGESPAKGLEVQGRLVCLGNWQGFNLTERRALGWEAEIEGTKKDEAEEVDGTRDEKYCGPCQWLWTFSRSPRKPWTDLKQG